DPRRCRRPAAGADGGCRCPRPGLGDPRCRGRRLLLQHDRSVGRHGAGGPARRAGPRPPRGVSALLRSLQGYVPGGRRHRAAPDTHGALVPKGYHALPGGKAGALGLTVGKESHPRSWPAAIIPSWPESRPKVTVHGPRVTSVQRAIEPRTGRGRGFAVEWPKVGGRGRRAAFKRRFPAPISTETPAPT